MTRNIRGHYQSKGERTPTLNQWVIQVHHNLNKYLGNTEENVKRLVERVEGESNAIEGEFKKEGVTNGEKL